MQTSTLLIAPFALHLLHFSLADKIAMPTEDTSACDSKNSFVGEVTSLLQVEVSRSSAKEVASISASAAAPDSQTLLQKTESVSRAGIGGDRKALKVHPLDGQVSTRIWQPSDWLFTSSPNSCVKPAWDITQFALASRVCLPTLFLVLLGYTVLIGMQEGDEGSKDVQTNVRQPRRHDLDFARIICVAAVVSEHSGGSDWTKHNVLFVLQWVLPYLYLTSAISWMMSSKSAGPYIWRLSMVLAVGVGANWLADVLTGRHWKGDFGNTIFQMFYVVMLMAMSVLTGPLRQALLSRKKHPDSKVGFCVQVVALLAYGLITLFALVLFVNQKQGEALVHIPQSSWFNNLRPLVNDFPITMIQICGALFLSHVACLFKANDIFPWFLLVHIFLPRIFIPWYQVGFIHNLELFVWGMVAESWGLRGKETITTVVRNYWPIMAFALMLASMPDMFGRCDLMPASTVLERIRFYGVEMALCLVLVTGSFKLGDPYNCTEWLSYWALYAYCFHVAWARLLPVPYGATVTYVSAVLVYCAWRLFFHEQGHSWVGHTRSWVSEARINHKTGS